MTIKLKVFSAITLIIVVFLFANTTFAQPDPASDNIDRMSDNLDQQQLLDGAEVRPPAIEALPVDLSQPQNFKDVVYSIIGILSYATYVIVGLGVVTFLWGVLGYLTAADNEEKRRESVKVITYGIIGIFVMVSVWSLVNILGNTFDFGIGNTMRYNSTYRPDNYAKTRPDLFDNQSQGGIGDIGAANNDYDKDGVVNSKDNCPNKYNPKQEDSDRDGIGDACDSQ